MAHTHAAKKSFRQSLKHRAHNVRILGDVRQTLHDARRAIKLKKADDAKDLVLKTVRAFDRAVAKGVIKKNAAARKKSRLMRAFVQLSKQPVAVS